MNKNKITFLDCTLRDGGYYNKWDFSTTKARSLIEALNKAGVQIIELGYKSLYNKKEFQGLFRYCNEEYLDFLSKEDAAKYAFMIDVKEFVNEGQIDTENLDRYILDTKNSIFSWVRMATHFATVESIPELTSYFKNKGYQVAFNLMGGSLLTREQVKRGAEIATDAAVDVFYVADSFGSFYPEDMRGLVRFIKKHYQGALGVHSHDNQGLAYANSLAAIEEGVEFVDGTVTGMGRGAGNMLTEQFLLGYSEKFVDTRFKPDELLPIINEYIEPMKKKHGWGFAYTYMYSGLSNIHPTYCQSLIETIRFTNQEIGQILEKIPKQYRSKHNKKVLKESIDAHLQADIHHTCNEECEKFNPNRINSEKVIIVARGNSAHEHIEDIIKFSIKNNAKILECNHTGFIPPEVKRFLVILNQLRVEQWLQSSTKNNQAEIIAGTTIPLNKNRQNVSFYPFQIGTFNPHGEELHIPDYDVGIYAIALAMKAGCKNIYLAGFDGFQELHTNQAKDAIYHQILECALNSGTKISHITPSTYSTFTHDSLYTL